MPRGINDYDIAELQGRNVANSNSLNIISPGLITDGLVLHLDAGNYASYPVSGATCFDISNTLNNGSLVSSPSYTNAGGGAFTLNGSSQYIASTFNPISSNSSFSIEMWLRITTLNGNFRCLADSGNLGVGTTGYCLAINNINQVYVAVNGGYKSVTTTLTTNTWIHVVGTAQYSAPYGLDVYINGAKGATSAFFNDSTLTANASLISFGRRSSGAAEYFPGDVAVGRVYAKALTATEVEQNFNATRARFGI